MSGEFVHLHTHSEYSLLDGLGRIKDLVKEAKRLGQPALAITDHGVMHGAVEFFRACRSAEIKPLIGIEAYQTLWGRPMAGRDPQLDKENYHLLLLARDMTGYQNLLQIASRSQLEGFYYKPRVDHDFLAAHAQGLICSTGCLGAEVPQLLMQGREKEAYERLGWYVEVFGKENFFVELQEHTIPELVQVNRLLVPWADRFGLQLVVTNDVHYVREADGGPHDVLLCVQTGALVTDAKRMRLSDGSYFLKSREQMEATFRPLVDLPASAFDHTLRIAEMCEVNLEDPTYHLPNLEVPPGHTYETYLRHLTEEGLARLYGDRAIDPELQERKERELHIIHQMGFDVYFLIVADLCNFARSRNIWWNVRGSGAGSLVAYCTGITGIDPIKNNLIFERFLNPGRVTMPDFDLDFPDDQREEMIRYTVQKFGEEQVAQIVTFGRMKARAAIRDVGRVKDVPLSDVDRIAKMIPAIPGKPATIHDVLDPENEFYNAELVELYTQQPWARELLDTSMQLEGVARHAGIHAAAVIVADRELTHYAPLMRGTKATITSTIAQFEFPILESIGLLKVDFLGLSTLSVMREAARLIRERHGRTLDLSTIPFEGEEAAEAFKLLSSGEVSGVFQVESQGMRRVLTEMRPSAFEHIVATISLYRPGPMEYIPNFIRRMHGDEAVAYQHPRLEPILGETYGICVYQEQIIQILSQLAGYAPGEADLVRRAISKKKASDIEYHKAGFVKGCTERGIPEETASAIYGDIEFFARYGFNKCLPGDAEVVDAATGRLIRVEDLYHGRAALEAVVTCDTGSLRLRHGAVADVVANGVKPVYRLQTALGRQIEATANHPFYTFDGWRTLEELAVDDMIAVPRCLPVEGNTEWPDHEVIALGHLLAEGNLCQKGEEIPPAAFTLTNRQVGLLISRMWEGDGHIDVKGRSLFYATTSERMARQLQHLLLRLGIISRLRTVVFPYKDGRTGYQLFVTGNDNLVHFHERIAAHFVSEARRSQLASMCLAQPLSSGTKDVIPVAVKELVRTAKVLRGVTWTEIQSAIGVAQREFYPTGAASKRGFARPTIQRLADYFGSDELRRYGESDIYWDRVVAVEYVGEKPTYDLEVPATHNFVANDILVHNSHAADYAVITVQTAYLKAHYPVEYMAALLLVERDKTEKVVNFINECRRMGVDVLPPDINYSGLDFEIQARPADTPTSAHRDPQLGYPFPVPDGSAIRFGMAAVKNVGEGPVQAILAARREGGPFASLEDLCERVDLRQVNKRALECLVKVGALDRFGMRSQLLAVLDELVARSASVHSARESGQLSMFDLFADMSAAATAPIRLPEMEEVKGRERLQWEKELLGVYAMSHPLQQLSVDLRNVVTCGCSELDERYDGRNIVMAGMISSVRTITTKKGEPMAFVQLEDLQGQCEVVFFPRTYAEARDKLAVDSVVVIKGKAQSREGQTSLLADSVQNYVEQHFGVENGDEPYQKQLIDLAPTVNGLSALAEEADKDDLVVDEDGVPAPAEENPFRAEMPAWMKDEAEVAGVNGRPPAELASVRQAVATLSTPAQPEPLPPAAEPVAAALAVAAKAAAVSPAAPPQSPVASAAPPAMPAPAAAGNGPQPPRRPNSDRGQPPDGQRRRLYITFRRSGDLDRDKYRLKEIYDRVRDPYGRDRFYILLEAGGKRYELAFPNDACSISERLTNELVKHFRTEVTVQEGEARE